MSQEPEDNPLDTSDAALPHDEAEPVPYEAEPVPYEAEPVHDEAEPVHDEAEPVHDEAEPAPEEAQHDFEAADPEPAGQPEPAEPLSPAEPTPLQPCTNCSTLLDVGDLEPFAKVHCPICGTAIRARTQLKNFTLVEVLGAGGMGAVYKALDTHLNRMVALKVVRKELSADAEYLAKFEREARITASVNHPNVVKVYAFGSDHGLYYIAMELVDKGSLDDLMNLQGRVAEAQALGVGIQVAQGLQAAHQRGLIHRDVKPGNILFADAQTAKIVDFGLALLAEHEAEERGEVWGTPYYVAPEKLDHLPEDFRSDIYSLGGTLFHAISGRPPFEADTASMVALKHLKSKAVSLQAFAPDVSSATAYVINRTLNKDPAQRYQSYGELIEHLEYARGQLAAAGAGPRKPRQRVVVDEQKGAGIIALVMVLLLIGVAVGIFHFRDRIFPRRDDAASTGSAAAEDGEAATRRLYDQFAAARSEVLSGDLAGAQDTFQRLSTSDLITQPLENWVVMNEGLVSLLQENTGDATEWFRVVRDRSHFSNDPSDGPLVHFFSEVGGAMASDSLIPAPAAAGFAKDSGEALAPLLYALKDWSLGGFDEAGKLLAIYLGSNPQGPFQWVAEYKPLAQKYAAQAAAYQQARAAAAAADTPAKRAAALSQVVSLEARAKGKMAASLQQIEQDLRNRSASQDAAWNLRAGEEKRRDDAALADARRTYAALCADFRFDAAAAALNAAAVTGADGLREKERLLKKAAWLRQFKAQIIQDLNVYGYSGTLVNRSGAPLPAGTQKATESGLLIQTQFGALPVPWNSLPPGALLAMSGQFSQALAITAPRQAADLQWLSGVFACEEGMARQGRALLLQASQLQPAYREQLDLFPGTE